MTAWYNEFDKEKAAWLRELIKAGMIAPGDVDERSIKDVDAAELVGYAQCHFFAGIGIWSYALRLAGWPDNRPVWTGSCPCPSFSAAGKGAGFDDPRHLWPDWARLIRQRKPPVVFGEQVDDAIGFGWLDLVQAELEAEAYAVGKAVLGAASVGAPHIRQRLYFAAEKLADTIGRGCGTGGQRGGLLSEISTTGADFALPASVRGKVGGLAHNISDERRQVGSDAGRSNQGSREEGLEQRPLCSSPVNGFWSAADWIYCRDNKYRPVEPGTFPLAHGAPQRVGRLRGYGDDITAQTAQAFIESSMEILDENRFPSRPLPHSNERISYKGGCAP